MVVRADATADHEHGGAHGRGPFPALEAGIAVQAYLPGSLTTLEHLQEWAAQRRAAGGAPIKVRIVKGANLGLETTEAELRGWPRATWDSKPKTDAHF